MPDILYARAEHTKKPPDFITFLRHHIAQIENQ